MAKKSFVESLTIVKDDMLEIGITAAIAAKSTGDKQKIRDTNMAYRCNMQAIRDLVRYHVIVKKIQIE